MRSLVFPGPLLVVRPRGWPGLRRIRADIAPADCPAPSRTAQPGWLSGACGTTPALSKNDSSIMGAFSASIMKAFHSAKFRQYVSSELASNAVLVLRLISCRRIRSHSALASALRSLGFLGRPKANTDPPRGWALLFTPLSQASFSVSAGRITCRHSVRAKVLVEKFPVSCRLSLQHPPRFAKQPIPCG